MRCHVFANADSCSSVDDKASCPFDELRMISTQLSTQPSTDDLDLGTFDRALVMQLASRFPICLEQG
jgi:hypothetical protein